MLRPYVRIVSGAPKKSIGWPYLADLFLLRITGDKARKRQSFAAVVKASALRSVKGKGKRSTYIGVGEIRIRPSMDGTQLIVESIAKKKRAQPIDAIKGVLS